ncbi:GNAT family N-acetyltransferase [Oceanobacillus sp. FSL K6-0251]|uniref:GNAT family N-acetyltransferase n=1 Tax=Oceanobacillus sp. FSL K6-0251 TaxID=2921602 RepID=UPI0030FB49EB
MVLIRKADVTDAGAIGKVSVESWQTTYRGIMADRVLKRLSVEDRVENWKNTIQADESTTFVAVDTEEQIGGFLNIAVKESADSARIGEITAVYLLENWQGQGIGKMLLLTAFTCFVEQSIYTVRVEVLSENDSRLFYEQFGAEMIEKKNIQIADDVLDLLVYEWKDISSIVKMN